MTLQRMLPLGLFFFSCQFFLIADLSATFPLRKELKRVPPFISVQDCGCAYVFAIFTRWRRTPTIKMLKLTSQPLAMLTRCISGHQRPFFQDAPGCILKVPGHTFPVCMCSVYSTSNTKIP